MAETNITITYETLYEILRRERDREDLQELSSSFLKDTLHYLRQKHEIITRQADTVFHDDEKQLAQRQMDNIRKILKELYDRREKKIAAMALAGSRLGSSKILDRGMLLAEEQAMLEELTVTLRRFRQGIVDSVLSCSEVSIGSMPRLQQAASVSGKQDTDGQEIINSKKLMRFICAVPKFVAEDMNVYGPFEADDVANLPLKVADILINKNRAEEIDG